MTSEIDEIYIGDDEDITKNKINNDYNCAENNNSDEEIEFYEIEDYTKKAKPPIPSKIIDYGSDLEIVDCDFDVKCGINETFSKKNQNILNNKEKILSSGSSKKSLRQKSQIKNTIPLNVNINYHCKDEEFMCKCVLCNKGSKNIVSHYVDFHTNDKNHEVYCARLPDLVIETFKRAPIVGELLEKKPYIFSVECIFCNNKFKGFHKESYEHYATHTGEYAWKCTSCNKRLAYKKDMLHHCKNLCQKGGKIDRFYVYKKENQISGTFCIQCNYIQLNKSNVIRHIENHHLITKKPERLCENIILVQFFRKSNTITSLENIREKNSPELIVNESITIQNEAVSSLIDNDIDEYNIEDNHLIQSQIHDDSINIKSEISFEETENELSDANSFKTNSETTLEKNVYATKDNSKAEYIYADSDNEFRSENSNETVKSFKRIETQILSQPTEMKKTQNKEFSFKDNNKDFSKKSLLKPWLEIVNTNEQNIIKNFSKINLSNFFKCMLCPFSTNSKEDILNHFNDHSLNKVLTSIISFECCYCSTTSNNAEELINHIKNEHSACNFQCSKCFYRSCSSFSVKLHIQRFHKKFYKIIACDDFEVSTSEERFKVMLENRQRHLQSFNCHLCGEQENSRFYLKADYENHFKRRHYNATFCKCDYHGLICCLYCIFETNSKDQIKIHMTDIHPNREQYAAIRFRNPRLNKTISSNPKSCVIVLLSESSVPEKDFVQSKNLKTQLKKVDLNKKDFKELAYKEGESLRSISYLTNELTSYSSSKFDADINEKLSLEVYQEEFYRMCKVAVADTGVSDKELYKCLLASCKIELSNSQEWENHIQIQHKNLLNEIHKCPHCSKYYRVIEFVNHFNNTHVLNKYFCYLCSFIGNTTGMVENHLLRFHKISQTYNKIILPENKYPEKFIAVIPSETICDISVLTLHMRNILKAARYHLKVRNFNEISEKTFDKDQNLLELSFNNNSNESNRDESIKNIIDLQVSTDNNAEFDCPPSEISNKIITTRSIKRSRSEGEGDINDSENNQQNKKIKSELIDQSNNIKIVHIFICQECNFEAFTRSELLIHKDQNHANYLNAIHTKNDRKNSCDSHKSLIEHNVVNNDIQKQINFVCDKCTIYFNNIFDFEHHNLINHKELLETLSLPITIDAMKQIKTEKTKINCKRTTKSCDNICLVDNENNKNEDGNIKCEINQSLVKTEDYSNKAKNTKSFLNPSVMVVIPNPVAHEQQIQNDPINIITEKPIRECTILEVIIAKDSREVQRTAVTHQDVLNIEKEIESSTNMDVKQIQDSNANILNMKRVIVPLQSTFELEHGIIYKCYYCPNKNNSMNILIQHWHENHPKNHSFRYNVLFLLQCSKCNERATFSELKSHFKNSHPNDDFLLIKPNYNSTSTTPKNICSECTYELNTIQELIKHNKDMHPNLMDQKISECENFSQNLLDKIQNIGYKTIIMLIKCNACDKEFTTKYKCNLHFYQKHHNDGIICSPIRFYHHHPIIFCKICEFYTNNIYSGIRHFRESHTKPFKCIYCENNFNKYKQLREHYHNIHGKLNVKEFNVNWICFEYELYGNNLIWNFTNGLIATTFELRNTKLAYKKDILRIMKEIEYSEILDNY